MPASNVNSHTRDRARRCSPCMEETRKDLGLAEVQFYIAGYWRTAVGLCTYEGLLTN